MISNDIKVSVLMLTYNHEKFIAQAIESVLMQKTNFKTELIIGDDCSSDDTKKIILRYKEKHPDKIKFIFQKINVGPVKNFIDTLNLCSGKYIAFLEGDDFWIDPFKLQKQVNFLENYTDFGLIHTNVIVVNEENENIYYSDKNKPTGDVFYFLLLKNSFIVTCTVCAKSSLIKEIVYRGLKENVTCIFDYWLWLNIAIRTKIYYMNEATAAYRSHINSLTKSNKSFLLKNIPLAILDVVKFKIENEKKLKFKEKWKLYEIFIRTLLNKQIGFNAKKKYFNVIFKNPFFTLTIFTAIIKKIVLKLKSKIWIS